MSEPMRMPLGLPEQLAKLDRLIKARVKEYRELHARGVMSLERCAKAQAECGDVRRSFAFLVANAGWIKPAWERRRAVHDHAATAALIEAFPDAELMPEGAEA